MWTWSGLDQCYDIPYASMTGEAVYDPLSAREFRLYYISVGSDVIIVTIPINFNDQDLVPEPAEPPVRCQTWLIFHTREKSLEIPFLQNGSYHCNTPCEDTGIYFAVKPLKDIGLGMSLEMFVSYEELGRPLQTVQIYADEGSGRVVIWGWDVKAQETKIFVGDLV